ncbi:MAG: hypothetical protein J6V82_02865 [Clostridia bacterium]|nr:hypothetical protein [Clostridia bacterium]MBO7150672.1 hypothetical protein [Clostridia bacterium]
MKNKKWILPVAIFAVLLAVLIVAFCLTGGPDTPTTPTLPNNGVELPVDWFD